MKVLVIGSGAREHAIAWKFNKSRRNSGLWVLPGNAGTATIAENIPDIAVEETEAIVKKAQELRIDLVFIGPEVPLSLGLADALRNAQIKTIGPGKVGAQLESSKAFSKEFMVRHKIPTATADIVENETDLKKAIEKRQGMVVIKKSGLAAGKGVLESNSAEEAFTFGKEHLASGPVVVEDYLKGYEVSVFVLCDGKNYKLFPPASDYKKAGDGNTGLNTGGMGSICPTPWISSAEMDEIEESIVKPSIKGMIKDNIDFQGILYVGIMMTEQGPKTLEYNVRFGDPEAQALIPLIESDFCNLFEATANQELGTFHLHISSDESLCLVLAAKGYPGPYKKEIEVELPRKDPTERQLIFHASTIEKEGKILTNGGRCFSLVGLGSDLLKARNRAYEMADQVKFEGAWYRSDIGNRIFGD